MEHQVITDDTPKITLDEKISLLYKCNSCAFRTTTIQELKVHKVSHQNTKETTKVFLHLCISCKFKTNDYTELNEHINSEHRQQAEFKCKDCVYESSMQSQLNDHITNTHANNTERNVFEKKSHENKVVIKARIEPLPEKSQFLKEQTSITCPFCQLESKNQDELKKHIEHIHIKSRKGYSKDIIQTTASDICTKCLECRFMGNKTEMKEHVEVKHGQKFACQVCGNNFISKIPLECHIQTNYERFHNQEPFPCEKCGLVLANFTLLQEHINAQQKSVYFQCRFCDYFSENVEKHEEHIIQYHEEFVILHTMAKQVNVMDDKFSDYERDKSETHQLLKNILDSQNAIKQELFLLRNMITKDNCQSNNVKNSAQHPTPHVPTFVPP